MEDRIRIKFWTNGTFEVEPPKLRYAGGNCTLLRLEVDKLSYFELLDYAMEYGSYESKNLWLYCKIPGDGRLKRLVMDRDVTEIVSMVNSTSDKGLAIYVQNQPIKKSKAQFTSPQDQPIDKPIDQPIVQPNTQPPSPLKPLVKVTASHPIDNDLDEIDSGGSDSYSESSKDNDSIDVSYKCDLDDVGSDKDDEEWRASIAAIKHVNEEDAKSNQKLLEECLKQSVDEVKEAYSSYEDSDADVHSPGESEDDNIRGNKYKEFVPVVNEQTNWFKFKWVVGIKFPTRDAFKDSVRKYAISNGRNVYIATSNSIRGGRLGVECVEGCPFYLYCSYHKDKSCSCILVNNDVLMYEI